ncbi:MAG TPA: PaaI family thioesterase [Spirochaetia bacterium]|nr:PaaI family thioesterase [Spirochaetia bacterium]
MEKIRNPFTRYEGYNCFGCCPGNPHGLQMEFYEEGGQVVSLWEPRDHFQGYGTVLHGGIQATLMDEIASWAVFITYKTAGVTSRMDIRFLKPVRTNRGKIVLRASAMEKTGRLATIRVLLTDSRETLCTEADIGYTLFSPEVARKKLAYPGYESFFER